MALTPSSIHGLRASARQIFQAALAAVDPGVAVHRALERYAAELASARRIFVLGAGKAAFPMALAIEQSLGDRVFAGSVNTKYGHAGSLERIACIECGHPVPDAAGVEGARRIAALARSAEAPDLVLFLLSGGASALMPLPAAHLTLEDKQETTRLLLASGANIHEINAVRKHLSRIKGGFLASMAAPARVIALILSDVIGDDLSVIGSGPTAPDVSTFADAREILMRRNLWGRVPAPVRAQLDAAKKRRPNPATASSPRSPTRLWAPIGKL